MQKLKASQLTSGMFVFLPTFRGTAFEGREYQGPVTVELNPDVPGSVLINYAGVTYETQASEELRVLPRPVMSSQLVFGTDPVKVLLRCNDFLIMAGWPQMAREQFIEYAQRGGVEHMLYTIRDVFELQEAA